MNSLDKLLTNTTNRFQDSQSVIFPQFPSNFTPIHHPHQNLQQSQSKNQSLIKQIAALNVPQTYEQLLQREKELMKILQEAKQEKQVMSALFEKIFLVEEGKEERMKKRFRRKKNEIQGKYSCEYCDKVYSSSTSLARHGKLKHPYSMTQPPQRDYQIPPQPNSINQESSEERMRSKEEEIHGLKKKKLPSNDSYEGDFESLEGSDDSHQQVMFSQKLT